MMYFLCRLTGTQSKCVSTLKISADSVFKVKVKVKVKVSLCLFKCHTMKAKWGGVKVQLPTFLNVALDGGEWSCSCPCCFTPNKGVLVSIEQ